MTKETNTIRPVIGDGTYVAPTAVVCGEVHLGEDCTILHHVVIRGDVSAIRIGRQVNIQDGTIVHTKTDVPLDIDDEVGIGHRAVVHCRRVGRRSLIGIGAVVLDDAEVGSGCLIAAGALVPPGMKIPDNKVVVGMPGRILRDTTNKDREYIDFVVDNYLKLNRRHAAGDYPPYRP